MLNFATHYSGARVLVTGANGFIGEHLARTLADQGAEVVGVYRSQPVDTLKINWQQCDLSDLNAVKRLLADAKPDYLFHLASHVLGRRDPDVVLSTFNSNLVSTVNLLTLCQEQDLQRIVLSNSLEEPERGDPHAVPSSPYAASKFAASAYGRMFHALYDMPVAIARIFMVYGPAQKDMKKLIPYVITELLHHRAPSLSSGVRPVDWIFVADLVQGLLAMGATDQVNGETIDLGSGSTHSVREVVEKLAEMIDNGVEPSFGALQDRAMEQVQMADVSATEKCTGWRPHTTLEDGLRQTIDWVAQTINV